MGSLSRCWCTVVALLAVGLAMVAGAATVVHAAVWADGRTRVEVPSWKVVEVTHETNGLELLTAVAPPRRLTRSSGFCPAISPDGHTVAFFTSQGLSVVDVRGGGAARRMGAAGPPASWAGEACSAVGTYRLAWSKDSKWLAFSFSGACPPTNRHCLTGSFIVGADGSGLRRLASGAAYAFSWSPDGRGLAATVKGTSLIAFSTIGGAQRVLSQPGDGVLGAPAWSGDGRLIAFGRHCSGAHRGPGGGDLMCDMTVIAADGTGERTLIHRQGASGPYAEAPAWLSTGELLVSQSYERQGIYAINARTGMIRKVGDQLVEVLTAGPHGTFAYLGSGGLYISDKTGHVLVRHAVFRPEVGFATIWLG